MKKRDIIFIIVIVLIVLLSFLIFFFNKPGGSKAVVTIRGEIYGTYNLDTDDTICIETEHGTNTVQIQDGKVRMLEASCPDQICVHSSALSQEAPGIIVCLPHELVVEIQE